MIDATLLARTTGEWRTVDGQPENLATRPASSFLVPDVPPHKPVASEIYAIRIPVERYMDAGRSQFGTVHY
jgi:hypothetical protein